MGHDSAAFHLQDTSRTTYHLPAGGFSCSMPRPQNPPTFDTAEPPARAALQDPLEWAWQTSARRQTSCPTHWQPSRCDLNNRVQKAVNEQSIWWVKAEISGGGWLSPEGMFAELTSMLASQWVHLKGMNHWTVGRFVPVFDFDKQWNGVKHLIWNTDSDNDDRLYRGPFCIT